jgi:hypothetical protein
MTGSFFEQVRKDEENIVQKDTGLLKDKFSQILTLYQDTNKSNYEKAVTAGSILVDIAPYVIKTSNKEVLVSGINVINGFLNIAKETQDQLLMNTAVRISENISM